MTSFHSRFSLIQLFMRPRLNRLFAIIGAVMLPDRLSTILICNKQRTCDCMAIDLGAFIGLGKERDELAKDPTIFFALYPRYTRTPLYIKWERFVHPASLFLLLSSARVRQIRTKNKRRALFIESTRISWRGTRSEWNLWIKRRGIRAKWNKK